MSNCPSRFTLVQWKSDDLPAIQQVEVNDHINSCDRCRSIVEELSENISEYHLTIDARRDRLQRAVRRERAGSDRGAKRASNVVLFKTRIAPAIGILAAAAAIAITIANPWGNAPELDTEDEISFKGDVSVKIVAQRGQKQFVVEDDTRMSEGDSLRFVITTAAPGYVEVFSLSADGEPAYFYPETEPTVEHSPQKIDSSGRHELPGSVVLDNSTGAEELVVLFSKEIFDRKKVHSKIAASRASGSSFPHIESIDVKITRIEKMPGAK